MRLGSRKTIPFFVVFILYSILPYKAYCLENQSIPVERNEVIDLSASEKRESDFGLDTGNTIE